jgi:hypothetical protein
MILASTKNRDDFYQYQEQGWFLPVPRRGMIFASTKNRDYFSQYQEQG